MKGSETEISTQKLLHDTYGLGKTGASNFQYFLNPGGASEYATEYEEIAYTWDKAKDKI